MGWDHGSAGKIEVIIVVDLDATNRNGLDSAHSSDETGAATSSTHIGSTILVSHRLPVQPEHVVLGREVQNVGSGTRLGTTPNAL